MGKSFYSVNSIYICMFFFLLVVVKLTESVFHMSTQYQNFFTRQGLNKLANNDGNKVRIIRKGALHIYKELLTIGNQKEQLLAVQGIRCLAFRCRDFIIQEPGCVVGQHQCRVICIKKAVLIVRICLQYNVFNVVEL